jgi:putative methyltransferase (TIGR04325 family)
MDTLARYLKPLLPPLLLDALNGFRNRHFSGDYRSWEDAEKDARGDYSEVLEDVKNALLKVKNGEAAFETDSVLFHEPQYNWPLLAILQKAANCREGSLGVLDFGGSLGTVYFQNRGFLSHLQKLRWCIVEQPSYVEVGRKFFQDEELSFHHSIAECVGSTPIDLVLVSGVLQLLREPYRIIEELLEKSAVHVVVDRTPFILTGDRDLLTVQTLPKALHHASFPHWFLNKEKFLKTFQRHGYRLVSEFDAYKCRNANIADTAYCGFYFRKEEPSPQDKR